ncbi:hypothetical protein [Marinicellulosiphila megalodicopiae]|uniref:hypothetical protein n=1 Tax=Marinicellulosiphila megalodicopiae TaxID=2724896 RepID=UPI003BB1A35E
MLLYEISDELFKLVGIFIACIIVFVITVYGFYTFEAKSKLKKVLGFFIVLPMAATLIWLSAFMLNENIHYTHKLKTLNDVSFVSGQIEYFDAYRGNMQKDETFEVGSVKFRYSPSLYSAGFNSPKKAKGKLFNGVFVEIWYSKNIILKIVIK